MHTSTYLSELLKNFIDPDNDCLESLIVMKNIRSYQIDLNIPLLELSYYYVRVFFVITQTQK